MKQTTAVVLVGAVGYFLGLGFVLPTGAEGFRLFATFGAIAGFGVGGLVAKRAKNFNLPSLIWISILNLLIGFASALGYMVMISLGIVAGVWPFIGLACLLLISFFCLGVAIPLSGLSFGSFSD
jgi:hypothetical protein